MRRSDLGVVRYGTPQGGDGFIANSALPWLSSFDITQQAPVYDQDMAWLRTSRPGTFTNYAHFGPPYSVDGGVLPPYRPDATEPTPLDTGGVSGIGDLVLRRADVVAPLPSITGTARSGCDAFGGAPAQVPGTPTELVVDPMTGAVAEVPAEASDEWNPWLWILLAAAAAFALSSGDGGNRR